MRRPSFLSLMAALLLLVSTAFARIPSRPRSEIQFPDLPGYQTLKCDFHMHTVFSDGRVWPTVRVLEAWQTGLDCIAITDHVEVHHFKNDVSMDTNRAYELTEKDAKQCDLLLIQGVEITKSTPPGHFNAIFLKDTTPLNVKDLFEQVKAASDQDGFVFWNHPGSSLFKDGRWGKEHENLYQQKQLQGIEVANGSRYYADAHRCAIENNLTLMGNTDSHWPILETKNTPDHHRTMTLVFAKERTVASVKEALQNRRTVVWLNDLLIGREEWLAPLFDACVHVHKPHAKIGKIYYVKVENRSNADIVLQRRGKLGPYHLTLPSQTTTLVQFPADGEKPAKLTYTATNLLIAPEKGLPVTLEIPAE